MSNDTSSTSDEFAFAVATDAIAVAGSTDEELDAAITALL